jgi:OTU domain-containing protein 3
LSPEDDAKNRAVAANVSHVLPWMVNVVISSLPYLADREKIRKTLEECKGNIDTAVSILLDAEERASISSQPGSSGTERDPDSDDEYVGPKKKQDRRMSRATKALKEKVEQQRRDQAMQSTAVAKLEPTPVIKLTPAAIELPVRPHKQEHPITASTKVRGDNEDGWVSRSDDDADDDFHLDMDDADDATSDHSGTSQSQFKVPSTASKPLQIVFSNSKSFQKQHGPQKKRETARERIERRKLAQKAARKETKRKGGQASRQLEVTSINVKKSSPPLDLLGIKTLYI